MTSAFWDKDENIFVDHLEDNTLKAVRYSSLLDRARQDPTSLEENC